MKKICLILLALSAAILSSAATSSRAESRMGAFGDLVPFTSVTVNAGQAPVFVQTSFGTIGLYVYETPTPMLGIISAPGAISEASADCFGWPESFQSCAPGTYNTSLIIYGNGKCYVRIVTDMGTFSSVIMIKGLPEYAPGDPRLPLFGGGLARIILD